MALLLSRRSFGTMLGTVALSSALPRGIAEQPGAGQFSVMMWTLKKIAGFEANLMRVAEAGYRRVELVGEFFQWSDTERTEMMTRMKSLGISVDATSGMKRGFADADTDAYLVELHTLVRAAQALGCPRLILLSGKTVESSGAGGAQWLRAVETLKRVADVLETAKMDAVIEPIDRLENPTIWMDNVTMAASIVREVASPRIKVLYDLYHEQRTYGNLIEKLEQNIGVIELIHVADVPGRHEPGTGEVNYTNIYRKLGELKYKGTIAMEFYPTGNATETLKRAREEAERSLAQAG